ncbi:HEPN domain-containing protein [Candidatus Micrarchaeota archaeon]|nr:HEPN domain-containing protein [Candidatus Micrarchaeota archaeon]
MTYQECFERGLLRKSTIERQEIENQIKIAENYIKKAEKIFDKELFDICFLTVYISIFHSARALLYIKGYKERSHYCLFEFVCVEFKDDKEIVRLAEMAQNYRTTRHLVQYDGELCSENTTKEALKDAKDFLMIAKKLIKNGGK